MSAGLPDASTLANYGGAKQNSRNIVNPLTDIDAGAGNQAMSDTAGMTRTSCRAWAIFAAAATTGAMVLLDWDAVWKTSTPTLPLLTRLATGTFKVTFPSTVTDELGAVHVVSFRRAMTSVASGTTPYLHVTTTGPNTATVAVFTAAASPAATDAVGVQFYVEIG